jgi:hypothetical protein
MSPQNLPTAPLSSLAKAIRQLWPWFLPLWVLPVPIFLICLRLGSPLVGALVVLLTGLMAGVPIIRGRVTLGVAYALICGITLLAWFVIYACILLALS